MLPEMHKNQRMATALSFLETYDKEGDSLLDQIVTEDETWARYINCETKKSIRNEAITSKDGDSFLNRKGVLLIRVYGMGYDNQL